MIDPKQSLDIQSLLTGYREGRFTPSDVVELVLARIAEQPDRKVWIHCLPARELVGYVQRVQDKTPDELPLYGIPFAIKDNIDLANTPTTAGCPDYSYTPAESAFVVHRLIEAGAIPVGKTNLDQFATGLVGTRSPFGACQNAFDPDYVSGGSSSGSAVAVATGLVSFALGTDTAGSGRVPAAFNNLVGLKPTRGLLSIRGVVPACRSLDCVSIFALTHDDAAAVFDVAEGFDAGDPFGRESARPVLGPGAITETDFRFGVPRPEQLEFFGNDEARRLFESTIERLEGVGGRLVPIDLDPFLQTARLLYEGAWVAERYLAIKDFIEERPQALHPVTREIIGGGAGCTAVDAFAGQYQLQRLRRMTEEVWKAVDVIVTPTAGTIYRIDEVKADPIKLNANLGYYTNFMNLLDLSAVAVPAGFQADGLPFGVTMFAPAFYDQALLRLGDRLHRAAALTVGATGVPLPAPVDGPARLPGECITVAVCGAHLSGLPLNHQLTERGAQLLEATQTAPVYRFYALPGGPPHRPGLVRDKQGGAIDVELWAVPAEQFGSFVAGIPAPLGIGKVELEDGRTVPGFICEAYAVADADDITALGGWREYLARKSSNAL